MYNAREVSILVIEDILFNQAYSNIALNRAIKKYDSQADEAFIRELVYGVVENKLYLEHILRKLSKLRLKKIHSKIYSILMLGLYQIYFLDKIPDTAAVNESVKLAKKYGNKGSIGFVNGVLRNVTRNKEELAKISAPSKEDYIAIKYSHPRWLVDYWVEEFGLDFTQDLCRANNQVADFNIRYNRLKLSKENLKESLRNLGYIVEDSRISKDSIIVKNPKGIFETKEFQEGYFTVQGGGSSLVGEIVNPRENSLVLDTCAAPGGKSLHMGEIMNNTGSLLARDIYKHRLDLIEENINRLGIKNIKIEEYDASVLDEKLLGQVDYCLVDAPCSGLGTIMGSPEIKYNRTREDLESLAQLQYKILNTAKNYLKDQGVLVYSTCTIGRIENDQVIERFLEENPDFSLEGKMVKLFPNLDGTDGFFICKLVRK